MYSIRGKKKRKKNYIIVRQRGVFFLVLVSSQYRESEDTLKVKQRIFIYNPF